MPPIKAIVDTCAACQMRTVCQGRGEALGALYVTSELLAEKVHGMLDRARIEFVRRAGLFGFASADTLDAAAAALISLSFPERRAIRVGAADLAGLINAPTLEKYLALRETAWFDRALRQNAFTSWFQPLVDLSTGLVFAHECLIRLDCGECHHGGEIVAAAFARKQIHAFDAHARQLAIREGSLQHEPGTYLFV